MGKIEYEHTNEEVFMNAFIRVQDFLKDHGIVAWIAFSANYDEISMHWAYNGTLNSLTAWSEFGDANFTAFNSQTRHASERFNGIEEFTENHWKHVINSVKKGE